MVPRPIGSGSPQCARCGKSVFMAEQVIGPYSRPYHKTCLTCTVCNKRLDSTLLVEHEGEPYCKNCHKAHLGQGKGGFGLAVPLRPDKPSALQSKPVSANGQSPRPQSEAARRVEERLNEEMSGISITPRRRDNSSPTRRETASPSYSPSPRLADLSSRPTTVAQSIDHLVASGVDVPIPYARQNGSPGRISQALYGDEEGYEAGGNIESTSYKSTSHRPASPLKNSYRFDDDDNDDDHDDYRQRASDLATAAPPRLHDYVEEPAAPAPTPLFARTASTTSKPTLPEPTTPTHRAYDYSTESGRGLPTPQRKDPIALARERERGVQYSGSNSAAKTYSPRTTPVSPAMSSGRGNGAGSGVDADQYAYSPNSALTKMGLGSTVSAAAVGTPLCARCERPVYFAEQKQAAGRKWHRACLRCDGCSTTLESGKLEEGPLSATYQHPTNVWCRTCYAKRFGPKGIGNAGMSLPEMMK